MEGRSMINEGIVDHQAMAKELIKRHGKDVTMQHIDDMIDGADDAHKVDKSEVLYHLKKLKDVKEGDEYDEKWKEYKGKSFKKESRMLKFNDYLKEAALSAKQKKIAAIAGDKEKIDADDLAALRAGKKPVEEASCSDKDMKKEELVGNQHKLDKNKNGKLDAQDFKMLRKEEAEQIDELSKDTLNSYVKGAASDLPRYGNTLGRLQTHGKLKDVEKKISRTINNRFRGVGRAADRLAKEEVQIEEGKMKELAYDLDNMSHDEFHKQYGKPKSYYDPKNFKKPVEAGKGMDRARALAQRGMQSLSKEEVERIEEKAAQLDELSKKTLGSYVNRAANQAIVKSLANPADKSDDMNTIAKREKGINLATKKLAKEETEQEMTPYLKATLSFMDESKYDDYKDALRAKKATQSAFDKDFKPDTTHPHIQVVKGTQYGGENQKDDEGDEKPEAEKEKRGRGRPSGSKSGARLKGGGHEDGGIPVHNLHLPKSYK
jgi:hypothetical protein